MTKNLLLLLLTFSSGFSIAQDKKENNNSYYDSALAKKLGADEYGMKKYVIAFLKAGNTKIDDPKESEKIQTAHLKNIIRLAEEGKLLIAGPFLDNQNLRGLFIFNVQTIEEAKALTETDPAVKRRAF